MTTSVHDIFNQITNPRILECVTIKENAKLATSVTQKEISVFHESSFIVDHAKWYQKISG